MGAKVGDGWIRRPRLRRRMRLPVLQGGVHVRRRRLRAPPPPFATTHARRAALAGCHALGARADDGAAQCGPNDLIRETLNGTDDTNNNVTRPSSELYASPKCNTRHPRHTDCCYTASGGWVDDSRGRPRKHQRRVGVGRGACAVRAPHRPSRRVGHSFEGCSESTRPTMPSARWARRLRRRLPGAPPDVRRQRSRQQDYAADPSGPRVRCQSIDHCAAANFCGLSQAGVAEGADHVIAGCMHPFDDVASLPCRPRHHPHRRRRPSPRRLPRRRPPQPCRPRCRRWHLENASRGPWATRRRTRTGPALHHVVPLLEFTPPHAPPRVRSSRPRAARRPSRHATSAAARQAAPPNPPRVRSQVRGPRGALVLRGRAAT